MYTQLVLGVDLKPDTPPWVINTLRFMLGDLATESDPIPEHALFKTARWGFMLRCDSYYFPGTTNSVMRFDETSREWKLTVHTNLKNYGGVIEAFCDWLRPYIANPEPGGFMGYSRYEEAEQPTLLYV